MEETNIKCPKCGSAKIVKILYGEPTLEALQVSERGEVVLGGCCISPDSPEWACLECRNQF